MDTLGLLPPVDPALPVLVPGDPERQSMARTRQSGFIRYTPNHINSYRSLAKQLGVEPMRKYAR